MNKDILVLEIPGVPIAKARARFAKRGNKIMSYDVQVHQKKWAQDFIRFATIAKNKWVSTTPLTMNIDCYFRPPNSFSKSDRNLQSWGQLFHTKKPDCTNLAKFYEDILNGIVFHDDKQLVSVHINKYYGEKDKTILKIMPKINYEEEVSEFLKSINFSDFKSLSHELYDLTVQLEYLTEDERETPEEDRLQKMKSAIEIFKKISSQFASQILNVTKQKKSINKKF